MSRPAKPRRSAPSQSRSADRSVSDRSGGDHADPPNPEQQPEQHGDPDGPAQPDAAAEQAQPEPGNRAERRAQRRGKQPPPPPAGRGGHPGHRDQVVVPRRAGRRGNR